MRRFSIVIALAALFGLASAFTIGVRAQRLPPHRFFGRVTLNDAPPSAGTRVEGLIAGKVCGAGQTSGQGNYVVDVDSSASTPGCGASGVPVTFRIAGLPATQTAAFRTGGYERLELTARGIAGGFEIAALNMDEVRPCIPEPGQRQCDATREALWNGRPDAWRARGITDPDAVFNETVVFRIRASDPRVISLIARFLGAPYLQVTRVRFIGAAPGQADEYVEITNLGGGDQDMTGWSLRSPVRAAVFRFPNNLVMTAGRACRVYTGATAGAESACGLPSVGGADVWPDDGGRVVLYHDALDLPGAGTTYSADSRDQPLPPGLQGVGGP